MSVQDRFFRHRYRTKDLLILGEVRLRTGKRYSFGLLPGDRLRHTWCIGQTGVGKSTLLSSLIAQDLHAGHGLAVIDPHGPLAKTTLASVPTSRTEEVCLIEPQNTSSPLAFNVFKPHQNKGHVDRALLASKLISTFKAQWADNWGPRLEHVLRCAILAVAEHPDATLMLLYRFLTDDHVQTQTLTYVNDDMIRAFWTVEWPRYTKALRADAVSPVLNKLGAFIMNPIIRPMMSCVVSRLDIHELIEQRGILIADLSTGGLGADTSKLLGGLLLSSIELAAMSRSVPVKSPFFVYLDEFQRFVSESLPTLLSESRKFGLGLVLAHQYLRQLPSTVQAAMLGNVGTVLTLRVGSQDASVLAPLYEPTLPESALLSLAPYTMAVRQLAYCPNPLYYDQLKG